MACNVPLRAFLSVDIGRIARIRIGVRVRQAPAVTDRRPRFLS